MRTILIYTLGLGGAGAAAYGLYLYAGLPVALMVGGSVAMIVALIAQLRGGR